MSIFRSKEIQQITKLLAFISILLIIIGFIIDIWTGILVLITAFLFCCSFYIFTRSRYRQIKKLSEYLRRISAGEYSLDIRDNSEGELSILKSEIYKVTLMLTENNEKLNRDKLLLSDQMADISHQLKTPLTSMMVMMDLLRDESLPVEKRMEFNNHMSSQLERMEWLIAALLKMSKLDAGVIIMKIEKISASSLIENALRPFHISMEIKEISYCVCVGNEYVMCDFNWTTEALMNIIKNCIEHTAKGGKLKISVSDNPLYLEIKIEDNGIGIKKEDLPHIFTRFYRGKNAAHESVGIGLALSYSIIRSQQGDISVKSEPGIGSTFKIHLYKSVV